MSREDYDRLRPLSYVDTDVMAICFSAVDDVSFQNVANKWLPEARHHLPTTPLVLVSLKADLRSNEVTLAKLAQHGRSAVLWSDAAAFAAEYGLEFIELSSHTGEGIDDLLLLLFASGSGKHSAEAAKRKVSKACTLL